MPVWILVVAFVLTACPRDLGPIANQVRNHLSARLADAEIGFGPDLGAPSERRRIGDPFDVQVALPGIGDALVFEPGGLDLSSCDDGGPGDGDTDGTELPTDLPTLPTEDPTVVPTDVQDDIVVPLDPPQFTWTTTGALVDRANEASPVGQFAVSASPVSPGRSPRGHSVEARVAVVAHPERVPALAACGVDSAIRVTRRLHLPVPTVPLELPATVALFVDRDYRGPGLVYVPSGVPDALAQREGLLRHLLEVEQVLERAQDDVVGLRGDLRFLSALAPLGVLTDALDDNVVFRRGDEDRDLNDIRMRDRFDFNSGVLDVEAEDEMSSVAFVGAPRSEVTLFNEPGLEAGQGILRLVAGPGLGVAAGDLHEVRDIVREGAGVIGSGSMFVDEEPHGQRCCDPFELGDQRREIRHFGDEFSSLRFGGGSS